jgi:hypothetical protein
LAVSKKLFHLCAAKIKMHNKQMQHSNLHIAMKNVFGLIGTDTISRGMYAAS